MAHRIMKQSWSCSTTLPHTPLSSAWVMEISHLPNPLRCVFLSSFGFSTRSCSFGFSLTRYLAHPVNMSLPLYAVHHYDAVSCFSSCSVDSSFSWTGHYVCLNTCLQTGPFFLHLTYLARIYEIHTSVGAGLTGNLHNVSFDFCLRRSRFL